jgi:DNA-binding IclR family transcriptional regulator
MESVSGVGVLDKSVAILAALAEQGRASLPELVAATGLPRPTAHRLATALEAHGLVGRDGDGRFCLGARLVAWGSDAARHAPLPSLAAPVLAALRDETGESAQLYVRAGDHRVCVAVAERPSGLRTTVPLGARLTLTAGSGAKVLLAWADPAEWPPGVDRAALAATRRAGWAASVAEREAGVASVSAPVWGGGRRGAGAVVAAIGVSGPVERLGRRPGSRFARPVVAAGEVLSRAL